MTEFDPLRRVILCAPEYYELMPINSIARSHASQGISIQQKVCLAEHEELAHAYRSLGTAVSYVDPDSHLIFQTYIRDIAFLMRNGLVLGQFEEHSRKGESQAFIESFGEELTFLAELDAPETYLEGSDIVVLDETCIAVGVGLRTSGGGASWLSQLLAPGGVRVVRVPFDPDYVHLDIFFNVIAPKLALAVTELLPDSFLSLLEGMGFELLKVDVRAALEDLACNVVSVGNETIVSTAKNSSVNEMLKALGFEVLTPDLRQLLVGGGGVRCLTLPVERDTEDSLLNLKASEPRQGKDDHHRYQRQ